MTRLETDTAIATLSALAQANRIEIFRLLVRAGLDGMAAGDIARKLDMSPTRTSFHLRELERTGLVTSRREGRFIIYSPEFAQMRALLTFLLDDCCQGHPEMCAPLIAIAEASSNGDDAGGNRTVSKARDALGGNDGVSTS